MQQTFKKILQSAAFAILALVGCTYTGRGSYDPETGIERNEDTDSEENTLEEKLQSLIDEHFQETLQQHDYRIYAAYFNKHHALSGESPHLVIVTDVHTRPVRERNNAVLTDLLTKNDVLLIEGYLVGNQNPDLEKKFFEVTQQTQEEQEEIGAAALANRNQKDTDTPYGYFNQGFPSIIDSCENDFFVTAHFKAKSLSDTRLRKHSIHYRNMAMAETLEKKMQACPTTTFYHVIGAQHVIDPETFREIGIQTSKEFDETSGELCSILEKKKISYILIGPQDIREEIIKGRDHPELRID